ncbi:3-hydroxyacyl-ACP dehydratase FabZ [Alkalilimnicola ehrlichii MLHE-1]|uniref:3-hydroxyacyl-[acyl-carrier-protein] dehydratase FabZ n=1 Tax=Alkalilimnicola ehrlichii (strain ATCC BAA-1101 / DSM 17681 / MLHE-1) TaxID=187272 RepID=FABZ_ALKEH|nr:3-hydroxyacyl-ACP dehydratase FabZ [Alkalilimnicola ehrlichii]Q0A7J0.1 RecName: Full=3-hydroxyacyl-[acyl-carrier-protein] dehydratase FabZ; AltName: Full=(3R)-hydroxymyristoyl-[acyl-carrier-protein] dehydratase; Short=(3R)-hydroxymyristoyl-ACP dehydrase; AltName: Full=Beta-hydroxyacyl-ACP dehydratase [Alkalilimnicola ehrlichii MLHE-1]ABI57197.1 3-hydroxyacyl-[acyl-carrier-protein] dehydratase [Alkalilimnicola ehrlichii MLHE-1]
MNASTETSIALPDINDIMRNLPHRYPMLLIDRVVAFSKRERLVGIKNVTINEPYFAGHFPQKPVMPGVLILESMAQACGMLAFKSEQEELGGNHIIYLVAIDKARFKRPVEPGDQLRLEASLKRVMRGLWMFQAQAWVGDALAAEAEIRCTVKEA